MLTVGICEDVDEERLYLKNVIEGYFMKRDIVCKVYDYRDGRDLLKMNSESAFDIVFLDVQMPGIDGINVGKALRQTNKRAKVVYVTGYKGYIQAAVDEVHCFFYLVKPLAPPAIEDALTKVMSYLVEGQARVEIVANKTRLYFLPEELYYFEHSGRKTLVVTKAGVFENYDALTDLAQKYAALGFAMPHRAYLVSLANIVSIEGDNIILTNKQKIALSRRRLPDFIRAYNTYLQKFLF